MLRSKALWALTLCFLALHLVLAVAMPLVEDEAYYQLWATVPSAGYYDHPPMVAWLIAAGQAVFGETLLGVRAMFILASAVLTLMVFRIAWLFSQDEAVSLRAALWAKIMVPMAVLGFAATPDAPSVLFWTATTWAVVEAVKGNGKGWWLAAGLFGGLGILSKFTVLFLGLALVVWLFASREGRGWLKTWQVWAGAALGILVLVPFGVWNHTNGWIGLERQFGRVGADGAFSLVDFTLFWLSVPLLITPLLAWLVFRGIFSSVVPRVLVWLIAPVFLYMAYHATKSLAGGQWLVPAYPTLAVIAALTAGKGWVARWAAPSGLALGALVLVLGLWPGKAIIAGHNPFTQIRGWDATKAEISALAKAEGAEWIATNAYGLTGQLHHYLASDIRVWQMTEPYRYLFRGGFPSELCDKTGLFISRQKFPDTVPYFKHADARPEITRREGEQVLMPYGVAVVSGVLPGAANTCQN